MTYENWIDSHRMEISFGYTVGPVRNPGKPQNPFGEEYPHEYDD